MLQSTVRTLYFSGSCPSRYPLRLQKSRNICRSPRLLPIFSGYTPPGYKTFCVPCPRLRRLYSAGLRLGSSIGRNGMLLTCHLSTIDAASMLLCRSTSAMSSYNMKDICTILRGIARIISLLLFLLMVMSIAGPSYLSAAYPVHKHSLQLDTSMDGNCVAYILEKLSSQRTWLAWVTVLRAHMEENNEHFVLGCVL